MERNEIPFELESLAHAKRYQAWVADFVTPHLGSRVLELGAGMGNMSAWLPRRERLILTESDPRLLSILADLPWIHESPGIVRVAPLDLSRDDGSALADERLDTIVSFNVLEHVEDDVAALRNLMGLLRRSPSPRRRLVTFVPAHPWAFGGMDRRFGHFRRYSREYVESLARTVAPDARLELKFFNLVGLGGWILNGRVLGRSQVGASAIQTFEHLSPLIRRFESGVRRIFDAPMGQSLLFILHLP